MRYLIFLLFVISSYSHNAQNSYPEISNLYASHDFSSNFVTVTFDLKDAENEDIFIHFLVSDDGGETYGISTEKAFGDVGTSIPPRMTHDFLE